MEGGKQPILPSKNESDRFPRQSERHSGEARVDGFESFEYSQYFPLHVNIAADAEVHFVYAFTDDPLRRKGRTTANQKKKLAQLEARYGRPDPKAVEKSMAEVVLLAVPQGSAVTIQSDKHPAYKRAFRRLFPSPIALPTIWQGHYDRAVETLCIPNGKRHDLSYAY